MQFEAAKPYSSYNDIDMSSYVKMPLNAKLGLRSDYDLPQLSQDSKEEQLPQQAEEHTYQTSLLRAYVPGGFGKAELGPPIVQIAEEPISLQSWLFPNLSREQAEAMLKAVSDSTKRDTFLVRSKLETPHSFVLSRFGNGEFRHYRILRQDFSGQYFLENCASDPNGKYSSVDDLIKNSPVCKNLVAIGRQK